MVNFQFSILISMEFAKEFYFINFKDKLEEKKNLNKKEKEKNFIHVMNNEFF